MHVQPKKGLGQHFLKDQEVAVRIVNLLEAPDADVILEIGPGMGVLTKLLLDRFGEKLHVVEVDPESVNYLKLHFPELKGRIYSEDFLKMDLHKMFTAYKIAVIGNYPYNISSQILFHLLDYPDQIVEIVGMFQREVARRITIGPGSKEYGILSVLLEFYYHREYAFTVSENVFTPPPKVKSGVLRLVKKSQIPDELNYRRFAKLVKAAFNQRRKTLRNSLSGFFEKGSLDSDLLNKRPEQLDLKGFLDLMKLFD
ncbi:MAG: 16S rRNA (adenine(1518)-N(6)/adenine(1519)-N(6))-dimethyltransferase RsmA [Bacteroidota bacterium]|nr:16S rRNA (adenine(1518)-N(6)/adenine(1519)-N(6))-dimethyltransferase RsmA [Bacteroidota bacterium]